MSQPTIVLGYVHGDMLDAAFKQSIDNFKAFDERSRRVAIAQGFERGNFVDDNRNAMVHDFLDTPADYLLFLDTDIEFEPHHPYVLLDEAVTNDRAIMSGIYYSFIIDGKLRPVWFTDPLKADGPVCAFGNFDPAEVVVPLAAAGMGFCLIRRDVFEKMWGVPEWAADYWTWFGRDRYRIPDGTFKHHGEDICFCLRAKKIGIQTWGHKGVAVKHWKKIPLDEELFRVLVEDAQRRGVEY